MNKVRKLFINNINETYKEQNVLLIFRGFSFKFLIELSEHFSSLNPYLSFTTDNKLDLKKINKSNIRKSITGNFLNELEGINFCSFEELLVSEPRVEDISAKIVLVNNDFFRDEIPNPTTQEFPDIDRAVAIDLENPPEDDEFTSIFSYSSNMKGEFNLLIYRTMIYSDPSSFDSIDYYNFSLNSNLKEDLAVKNQKNINSDVNKISINNNNDIFLSLAYDIYNENLSDELNNSFIVEEYDTKNNYDILKIIQSIYALDGFDISFYNKIDTKVDLKPRKELKDLLKKHWKSDGFRDINFYKSPSYESKEVYKTTQGEICEYILKQAENAQNSSSYNDIFLTAPTGAGKSILFQLPALHLASQDLVTIVVSPLKSLMYDQVDNLRNLYGVDNAIFINSELSLTEREDAIEGIKNKEYSIVYMAPELFLSYSIDHFIGDRKIGLIAIDEAHLVSTWGKGFRVDYWYLGTHLTKLKRWHKDSKGKRIQFPTVALTATAVHEGIEDVVFQTIDSLELDVGRDGLFVGSVKRNDIEFDHASFNPKGSYRDKKQQKTIEHIKSNIENNIKTVAYFPYASHIKETHAIMESENPEIANKVLKYYGKMKDKVLKKEAQDKFKNNEMITLFATKAFGMGIDISDIEQIYHHAPSGSLADYIQEVGRAARDKEIQGKAVTFFNNNDLQYSKVLFGLSSIKLYQIKWVLKKILDLFDNGGKKQNILASVGDFSHIFSSEKNDQGIANKVQSCLMMIEKDLILKRKFPVMLARPKRLFGTVFVELPIEIEGEFLKKYSSYLNLVKKGSDEDRSSGDIITEGNPNSIYKLYLDKLWEEKYRNENFASLKRKFYDKELFEEFSIVNTNTGEELVDSSQPIPIQRLELKFNKDKNGNNLYNDDIIEEFYFILDNIFDNIFGPELLGGLEGKYFSPNEFKRVVKKFIPNKSKSFYENFKEILNLFKEKPLSPYEMSKNAKRLGTDNTFLATQKRQEERKVGKFGQNDTQVYRVNKKAKWRVQRNIKMYFNHLMKTSDDINFGLQRFINTNTNNTSYKFKKDKIFIKIAQILEICDLCSFQTVGGEDAKIFIRINDPLRFRLTVNDDYYRNLISDDVFERFEFSTGLLEYFFSLQISSDKKWELVEDYFLGKDLSDQIEQFFQKNEK